MAINRIWQSGLETGSILEFDAINGSFAISSTFKATGAYSCTAPSSANHWGQVTVPDTRQIRFGFRFRTSTVFLDDGIRDFMFVRDVSSNPMFDLRSRSSDNRIELFVGGVSKDSAAGEMDLGTFFHLGLDVKIDSSSGWIKVYKEGIEILSFEGDTGNADLGFVMFGVNNDPGVNFCYYDDIYVDDTTGEGAAAPCPVKSFYYITPNGNGNYADWDGSDGNQVDNYLLVDEVPPDTADYVETAVVDEFDSYTMTTYTLGGGEILDAVIPIVEVKRDSTTEEIAIGTRYSGTDLIGSDQAPDTDWDYLWERQTTKPGGGAWDQTALDAVEAVIKSRGSY